MKVIAKTRMVEAGALRVPGDQFEVTEERFESLGDVVEVAPEETEPELKSDPEEGAGAEEQSSFDKVKSFIGYAGNEVDLGASNLSEITREDLEDLTKDQINDLFASFEGLELKPKMKHGEMIDAVIAYIEENREDGSE